MNEPDITVVADPAEVADLVTIDTLKTIDALSALTDPELEVLRQKSEAHILRILNFPLAEDQSVSRSVARNEYVDTYTKAITLQSLRLSRTPAKIIAVKVDQGGSFTTLATSEYEVRGGAGLVFKCGAAFQAGVTVSVEYFGGYLTPAQVAASSALTGPSLPVDIADAVASMAQIIHARESRDDVTIRSEADQHSDLGELRTEWTAGAGLERQLEARLAPFKWQA